MGVRMNPIERLIDFLNILLACSALAASEQTINGQDYLVQHWQCRTSSTLILIDSWRGWCTTNGYQYMGRPFFLEFDGRYAYYLDQFGEVLSGDGALVSNAYHPPCGS